MHPQRIVCLTEETTETLYLLGEAERIVGISAFATRPERARHDKPIVGGFSRISLERVLALTPDLVLGFSDLQADIAGQLIKLGVDVHIFNQRSVEQILQMICVLGGMVGCEARAASLVAELRDGLASIREAAMQLPKRPRVYFEEWDAPQISGIKWVSELVELAGGIDCFPELARESLAKNRIIADSQEVVRRAPDIIFGSWCGKKFQPSAVAARSGWSEIPAVCAGALHEIKSPIILQPGPAALTDGVRRMHQVIAAWAALTRSEA